MQPPHEIKINNYYLRKVCTLALVENVIAFRGGGGGRGGVDGACLKFAAHG